MGRGGCCNKFMMGVIGARHLIINLFRAVKPLLAALGVKPKVEDDNDNNGAPKS